jgi:beta-N-acetylhexosaminidase
MTEGQRAGQLFMLGINGATVSPAQSAAIGSAHIGSVWLVNNRRGGVATISPLAAQIQALATAQNTDGAGFFVAADQEGGLVQRLTGDGFSKIPTALVQGGIAVATLETEAATWGRELASAGINVNLAPVMDVVPPGTDVSNPPIGDLDREYGHDPQTAGEHGAAVVRGMAQAGIATTLKHFPGLGRVSGNTDTTAGVADTVTTAGDPYLSSFQAGIAAGAPFVMISLASYEEIDPGVPAVFSSKIIGTLLRGKLGFGGVVISDDLGAAAAVRDVAPGDRAIDFIAAGGDLMIVQGGPQTSAMAAAVVGRAGSDTAFAALVDAAALKVLEAKDAYGLLNCG